MDVQRRATRSRRELDHGELAAAVAAAQQDVDPRVLVPPHHQAPTSADERTEDYGQNLWKLA
jgi:hypothetical protein